MPRRRLPRAESSRHEPGSEPESGAKRQSFVHIIPSFFTFDLPQITDQRASRLPSISRRKTLYRRVCYWYAHAQFRFEFMQAQSLVETLI